MFPPPVATKTLYTIWKQIVKLIPPQIVLEAATETKILSRTFTPWSHLLALIYQQLTRTESLNGVCDAAAAFECEWGRMRGAQVPRRNTFSNANRRRDPRMAELVFWRMFDHLKGLCPDFASCKYRSFLSRFKERAIHALGEKAEVPDCHPHRFRRTAATTALNRGMPLDQVQQLLGHESMQTTLIYAKAADTIVKQQHKRLM